jgi:hypothetical protein
LQFLRGDQAGILHLHGHLSFPETVVFGSSSYEDICRDVPAQTYLRSIFTLGTVVFIGCGAGGDDPNFGGLLEWSRAALANCQHTHFHFARESERDHAHVRFQGLAVTEIVYGKEYNELGPFLNAISDRVVSQRKTSSSLEVLNAAQSEYDQQLRELAGGPTLSTLEHVRRHFELARALWRAGGRRAASLNMAWALMAKGKELAIRDRVEFALEAVEHLLDEGIDTHATILLGEVEPVIPQVASDAKAQARFRRLLSQCLKGRADLGKLFSLIGSNIEVSSGDDRSRLEAERAELHYLSGDVHLAAEDVGPEDGP